MEWDEDDREWDHEFDAHVAAWYQVLAQREFEFSISGCLEDFIYTVCRAGRLDDEALRDLLSEIEGLPETIRAGGAYDIELIIPNVFEAIIGEARDLLRSGLRDEAIRRLRLVAHPKWPSEQACFEAYRSAMAAADPFYATPLGASLLSGYAP